MRHASTVRALVNGRHQRARSVPDALLLGIQRACFRGVVIVAVATVLGVGWHEPHVPAPFPVEVVQTCPCPVPATEPGPWLPSSR